MCTTRAVLSNARALLRGAFANTADQLGLPAPGVGRIGDACSKQSWRSACVIEATLVLQMSTIVEAAKKPMPIKKAQKTVKKAASKAKSQVKGGASGADFWYGPNRPGFLGELRWRSMDESRIYPTGYNG